jgi:RNase P/RNase MRP subunit POP5
MVVKSVRGRRRYIVFTVPEEAGRSDVLSKLEDLAETMPDLRVITSFGGKAVVRCSPSETDAVTSKMKESYPGCESLITSGTLRKVREIYPELKVPQKKKR